MRCGVLARFLREQIERGKYIAGTSVSMGTGASIAVVPVGRRSVFRGRSLIRKSSTDEMRVSRYLSGEASHNRTSEALGRIHSFGLHVNQGLI
jgi:hypothetical protein